MLDIVGKISFSITINGNFLAVDKLFFGFSPLPLPLHHCMLQM